MAQPAARQHDPVTGTDVHIVLTPSPGGPVPTPVPLPFSGQIVSGTSADVLVIDGVLQDNGMVSFANRLSPEDAEAIRAYIADRARQLARDEATEKADVVHTAD